MLYGPHGDAHPMSPMHLAVVPIGAKHVLEASGDVVNELRIDSPPAGEQVCQITAGSNDQADLVVSCGIVSVRYGKSLNLFDHLNEVLAVDLSSVPQAMLAFQGIMAEQSRAIAGSDAMTGALMTQCLVHLFRRLPSQDEEALPWLMALQDERLARVIDLILDAPGDEYTVDSLAEIAAMSRSSFAEHFARSFGRSPMNFVNHIRMQRATQLLAVENLSIDEVARTIGYSSRSHFSRAFKEHSGLPPRDFRSESSAH